MAVRIKLDAVFTPMPCNVKHFREKYNLTHNEIAKRLSVKPGSYGSIESGHSLPSKPVLDRMCKVFKCKSTELYEAHLVALIIAHYEVMVELDAKKKEAGQVDSE